MIFEHLIIAGGQPPGLPFVKRLLKISKKIVTVDRGAEIALKLRVKPFLHVGDNDSFSLKFLKKLNPDAQIILNHDKCLSDLEFTLGQLNLRGQNIVLGAHKDFDSRPDHGFSNLILLSQFRNLYFAEEKTWIRGLSAGTKFSFKTKHKSLFSLITVGDLKNNTFISGARYNMNGQSLGSPTHGLSNISESRVSIKTSKPTLLFVNSDITQSKIDELK